jgi:molybdenum cofactor synthesis domain-containing protein
MSDAPTAAILIIGDEILSGRTQDTNVKYMAERLAALGIKLKEARVVPDLPEAIIEAVNALRARNTYLFTTGGIGPTHDDITTACVAQAFGREVVRHPEIVRLFHAHYADRVNEARLKMAEVPAGDDVSLIQNAATIAPGFRIGNVFVMAGIPSIARAMFEAVVPQLEQGRPMLSGSVEAEIREGDIATELTAIQAKYPAVSLGSYPTTREGKFWVCIVGRSTERGLIAQALDEVAALMRAKSASPSALLLP